jgi:putative ABC transport system permease protein
LDRDLGYDARGVVTAEIVLAAPRYREEPARRLLFWETLLGRTRTAPGVDVVSVANWVPAGFGGVSFVQLEGESSDRSAGYRVVSDEYFSAIDVPLLTGRMFESADGFGTERVAVVNRTLAARFWPGENPVGKRMRASSMEVEVPGGAPWLRVIGMVADVRHFGYETEPTSELFVLYRQLHTSLTSAMALVVRSPPERVNDLLRSLPGIVRSIDPALAAEVLPLESRIGSLVATRRLVMALLTVFSALALLLSAIGIYGLVSFAVAQRTREIGVRAALGARQSGILRLMWWNALRVVLAGAAVGVAGAFALTRLMQSMLFEVQAGDPLTFALALLVLLLASSLAALVPSVRAARLDPLVALRQM